MIVRATGDDAQALFLQFRTKRFRVRENLSLIFLEILAQRFAKGDCLSGDDVYQRPALNAGKQTSIDFLRVFFLAQNQSTARSTQSFMRGAGDVIRVRYR